MIRIGTRSPLLGSGGGISGLLLAALLRGVGRIAAVVGELSDRAPAESD